MRAGTLAWAELHGHRVEQISTLFQDPTGSPMFGPQFMGLVGGALLGRDILMFDYPAQRMGLVARGE